MFSVESFIRLVATVKVFSLMFIFVLTAKVFALERFAVYSIQTFTAKKLCYTVYPDCSIREYQSIITSGSLHFTHYGSIICQPIMLMVIMLEYTLDAGLLYSYIIIKKLFT